MVMIARLVFSISRDLQGRVATQIVVSRRALVVAET